MPGNLTPAAPSEVMPMGLCSQFQEVIALEQDLNEYADGRSTRKALALNARRGFQLSRPLTDAQLATLRTFYFTVARYGIPFWFYNLRETVPVGSWDPTGQNPVGRYTVAWEGGWTETLAVGRHGVTFTLREVA
jgi:hypothetical protein